MITYDKVKNREKLFISLTGLTPAEFEVLLPFFAAAYDDYLAEKIEKQKSRERVSGGGRKPALRTTGDMLLFILFYFKLYPLQVLTGFLFGMGQSQANEWIHKLSAVLKMTLNALNHLPERDPQELEKTLTEDGDTDFAIDGTDRGIQRPKDNEKQKEFYSGEKKKHSVKNNVIVSVGDRKVKYLSGTCEGKKHDKGICDEENLSFPGEITLYKDKGFQGYEPEGVNTKQPKKKPRGGELSVEEKVENAVISGVRVVVGHVISGVKRCRIVKDIFRNTKENFDDLVMEIACGLHNFRTGCR
jgi:hypothetical protein